MPSSPRSRSICVRVVNTSRCPAMSRVVRFTITVRSWTVGFPSQVETLQVTLDQPTFLPSRRLSYQRVRGASSAAPAPGAPAATTTRSSTGTSRSTRPGASAAGQANTPRWWESASSACVRPPARMLRRGAGAVGRAPSTRAGAVRAPRAPGRTACTRDSSRLSPRGPSRACSSPRAGAKARASRRRRPRVPRGGARCAGSRGRTAC